ncbi:unnamed protein product, partial [marine sediment metagenome]
YDYAGPEWDPDYVVELNHQLTTEENVEVGPAREICAPTWKTVGQGDPGLPPPEPHYVCYDVGRGASVWQGLFVETQFQATEETVGEVLTRLCAPARKNGVGDLDLPHLTCYAILTPIVDPTEVVNLHTQFGPEYVPVQAAMEFCLPTDKTVVSGPTPTPTPTPPPPTPTPPPGDCPDPSSVPWTTPPGDLDCDGYSSADEGTIGTDPNDPCANTSDPNDEADDRWPSDFDDNQVINVLDYGEVLPPYFGTSVPPTSARRDLV